MKEEFNSSSWKDFQQRYQGTYGWFEKENGERLLVLLAKVMDESLIFTDKRGIKFTANANKGNTFTFLPVERGCYNYKDNDVVVCRRVPQRQWKRGLCVDNTYITSLYDGSQLGVSFDTLEEIFVEKPNTALERFRKTLTGNVAFNTNFAAVNNRLYLYENKIGDVVGDVFKLTNKLFKQEVEDFVRKLQLPMAVTV